MDFHTYPPEERTLKVVIKGLTTNITEQELTEELQSKGNDKSIRTYTVCTVLYCIIRQEGKEADDTRDYATS